MFKTIEEALENLVGLEGDLKIPIESTDMTILNSIGRQVFRGKALTDRQRDVIIEKLDYYNIDYENVLRMPLREIDRSKYIKLIDDTDVPDLPKSQHSNTKYMKLRFPFNKRTIIALQETIFDHKISNHIHQKGSHEHYILCNEKNTFAIVGLFVNKSYEIDQELIDYYNKVKNILDNPRKHIPYADCNGVYNLPAR